MIRDLEKKGLLDKTLIATDTEFGRPAEFDNHGGRGHQDSAFSLVLAGGGLNHSGAYGVSDDHLGKKVVENPVSVPDFHATMFAALGIDPTKELDDSIKKTERRITAKMEGITRLAVKEAQNQGFIVTGWPGHNLGDYFIGLGLGVDAICSDVPVQVQEYIESKKR